MLIEFSVTNYRSIRTRAVLDMKASIIKEYADSVISCGKHRLLPVAVFYGANSSGKSNILSAIQTMCQVVITSVKLNPDEKLDYEPFLLDTVSKSEPTEFEVTFLSGEVTYRYGFKYNLNSIDQEHLYEKRPKEREFTLFERQDGNIWISPERFSEGQGKEVAVVDNRLFLSLVAQLNGETSKKVIQWFSDFGYLSGLSSFGYKDFTTKMFVEGGEMSKKAMQLFLDLRLGFERLDIVEKEINAEYLHIRDFPDEMKKKILEQLSGKKIAETTTTHNVLDEEGRVVSKEVFNKDDMESEGTKKIIEMSGPILDSLFNGNVLVVDELEAKLHPMLTRQLIRLFTEKTSNPKGSQLIFCTHDVTLLSGLFRRDEIWTVQKDEHDSTRISRVSDMTIKGEKIRNDKDLQRSYLSGDLGGVPF